MNTLEMRGLQAVLAMFGSLSVPAASMERPAAEPLVIVLDNRLVGTPPLQSLAHRFDVPTPSWRD